MAARMFRVTSVQRSSGERRSIPTAKSTHRALRGARGEMQLAGESIFAGLVPEYLQRLSEEPAMEGVGFDSLEIERNPDNERVLFNVSSRSLLDAKRSRQFASTTP